MDRLRRSRRPRCCTANSGITARRRVATKACRPSTIANAARVESIPWRKPETAHMARYYHLSSADQRPRTATECRRLTSKYGAGAGAHDAAASVERARHPNFLIQACRWGTLLRPTTSCWPKMIDARRNVSARSRMQESGPRQRGGNSHAPTALQYPHGFTSVMMERLAESDGPTPRRGGLTNKCRNHPPRGRYGAWIGASVEENSCARLARTRQEAKTGKTATGCEGKRQPRSDLTDPEQAAISYDATKSMRWRFAMGPSHGA